MLTTLAAIFGFGVIVFFHELGHFIAARLARLPVERFSIGFPPHILKIRTKHTEFCIGAIPLGGYVKVDLGTSGDTDPGTPWYSRAITALAGPVFNFALSVILFFIVLAFIGQDVSVFRTIVGPGPNDLGLAEGDTLLEVNGTPVSDYMTAALEMSSDPSGEILVGTPDGRIRTGYTLDGPEEAPGFQPFLPPVIGESIVGLPAFEAGLRAGDSVLSVNGDPVCCWTDLLEHVEQSRDQEMVVSFSREGQAYSARMTPIEIEGLSRIGVIASTPHERIRYPVVDAALFSVKTSLSATVMVFESLAAVFTRPREVMEMSGGPIFVAETLGREAGMGIGRLLESIAGISLAVMCFNLLPIPILDGGQILLLLYEGISKKRLSGRSIQIIQQVGLLIVLILFVVIMWRDLARLFLRVNQPGS